MTRKSFISKLLIGLLSFSILFSSVNSIKANADTFKVVTLGANLTDSQKTEMLKYFNVTKNDANIIEITSAEEYKALGNIATSAQLGTKSISCSYVEPTTSGGLDITTNNLTWVTDGMIKNALITAGVQNAKIKASAPFKVSGTAALTGILKGFESSSSGQKIDENKKDAANEEIVVTGNLGDKLGQDEATKLINDVKKNVIEGDPKNAEELQAIVDKAVVDYKDKLSTEDIEKINDLMTKINALNLDYSTIKDQLNDISDQLKEKLGSDEAQSIFAKIGEFFSNLMDSIQSFFSSDSSKDSSNDATVTPNDSSKK